MTCFAVAFLYDGKFPAYDKNIHGDYMDAKRAAEDIESQGHTNVRIYVFGSLMQELN